jgi:tetratricopeptide (TPR) repeat protein
MGDQQTSGGHSSTNLPCHTGDRMHSVMRTGPALAALCIIVATTAQGQEPSGCALADATQETWDRDCAAAIEQEHDRALKAELHFRRAYVLNGREKYQQALDDLNAASALHPHHPQYLHERAYTLNALGRYADSLADLDDEASLTPLDPAVYQERAFARAHLADFEGALADRSKEVQLRPGAADALLARAEARLWVGQFDLARQDLDATAAGDTQAGAADTDQRQHLSRLLDAWTLHSAGDDAAARCNRADSSGDYAQQTLIGDCTLAFLGAKTSQAKAVALTTRSIVWLVARQSRHDATTDLQTAAALEPGNPDRHTNLGFAYFQEAHSWAARQEFDRSLDIRRTFMALAGRAAANYNLGEKEAALRDARDSFNIRPNEAALWVLGALAQGR